ncbi:MAG: M48 family metalloprotease [Planctomycetes bacterium]|nr:M48 family metalloprotease [Planctomycetota bacterium]
MMQILILMLMMGLLAHDEAGMAVEPLWGHGAMALAALLPYAVIFMIVLAACARTRGVMRREPGRVTKTLHRLDLIIGAARAACVGVFMADLYLLGMLTWVRDLIGDWVLLPDLIVLAPPLATITAMWWAHYPIDRRMREATLIRNVDEGGPIFPIWSRRQYVLSQVRHQLLLMLAPLLLILTWTESVRHWATPGSTIEQYQVEFTMLGGVAAFALAPLMIRYIWDTVPLPESALRQRLLHLCGQYRVRVRQLLLWRTYGGMINGAVMGVIAPLRFILLTDGLLERMTDAQIEAVMAHELGHVKRHHMPWMIVCAGAALWFVGDLIAALTDHLQFVTGIEYKHLNHTAKLGVDGLSALFMIGAWALIFGYISRRFERQADTFAVQHLCETNVSAEAVDTVAGALKQVALLNHMTVEQRSWRHGSIQWRIDYLRSLVGKPVRKLSIDAQIRLIRWSSVAVMVGLFALDHGRTM